MLNRILPPPQVETPKVQVRCSEPSIMSGSSLQGWWMPSSVTEEFEYKDSVRPYKISSTYHHRENNISTNLICWLVLATQHYAMAWWLFEPFPLTSPAHNARRFLDTSCQSRDHVPLITGFSSIRAWVTQPLLGLLDYRQVQTATERTLDIHPL